MRATPPIVVTGFGRCGSTMAMHMLRAGGVPWVPGTYESGEQAGDAIEVRAGHASKLLLGGSARESDVWPGVVAVWCYRTPREQAKSIIKFMTALGERWPISVSAEARAIDHDTLAAVADIRASAMGLVRVDYDCTVLDPRFEARRLARELSPWVSLDAKAMAAVVHRRPWRCLEGLDTEISLTEGGIR